MLRPLTATLLLSAALPASAEPADLSFPRVGDRLRSERYVRTVGNADVGPCFPKSRSRTGPLEIWSWPDWTVEHYDRFEGRERVETRLYAADGSRRGTITYSGGHPSTVQWGEAALSVSSYSAVALGEATLWLPEGSDVVKGFEVDGGVFKAHSGTAEDVFSKAFRERLAQSVGGVALDQDSRWIRGVPTAYYRIELPGPSGDALLHAWATTHDNTSYLWTWRAAPSAAPHDVEALIALVEWTGGTP